MPKTLVLTHEYWPYRGGVARYLYNLFSGLDKDSYLVLTDNKASLGPNAFLTKFKYGFIRPSWLPALVGIIKLIRREKVSVIFTPNILPLGSLSLALNLLIKMPFIISLHGLDIRVALAKKRWLVKMILDRAKAIVVNSENTMRQLETLNLDRSKIVLIYPNVEIRKAQSEITRKIASELNPNNKLVILTVGRLVSRKGHHLVMQALSQMNTANIKYIAVGDGPELENLRRLRKELKLEGKVKFAYNVSDEELPSYYEMADIFALPNILTNDDAEGFGIVFLEAASFGLPIIAGRNGGVMEILSDKTARLVNTDDYQQVKAALEQLVASPTEREQLSGEARKVVNRFSDFDESISKLKAIL